MNFLSKEELEHHLHPDNNYLSGIESNSNEPTESIEPEVSIEHVEKAPIGRGKGNENLPEFLRHQIGALAQIEKGDTVAKMFDVSNSVVSQAKNGRISQDKPDEKLKNSNTETKNKAADLALDRLLSSLDQITDDDINCLGAKDKADVAVKMSKVYDNMRDKSTDGVSLPRIIINMSPVREEVHYDVIEVT